jgi:hypothetical protein
MAKRKRATATKEKNGDITDQLNEVAERSEERSGEKSIVVAESPENGQAATSNEESELDPEMEAFYDSLFEKWDDRDALPEDFFIEVSVDSLESAIGYSSLFRQMHKAFVRQVAYYKSPGGGSYPVEEARKLAFHACTNREEAKRIFKDMMRLPLDILSFVDLMELQSFAPRVAEWFWERAKTEGKKEFESGHAAANITFPVGYMKGLWNIARFLGVRESFIDEWNPRGGIEVALIDMMAQSYFQWQFWLEETVKRSQTREHEEHPEYSRWKAMRAQENKIYGRRDEGYWFRPLVSEKEAVEHAVQMADRWNRIFMRTLRQLRDLRRYSPVTINNPSQVNIAAEGGQQVNIQESNE